MPHFLNIFFYLIYQVGSYYFLFSIFYLFINKKIHRIFSNSKTINTWAAIPVWLSLKNGPCMLGDGYLFMGHWRMELGFLYWLIKKAAECSIFWVLRVNKREFAMINCPVIIQPMTQILLRILVEFKQFSWQGYGNKKDTHGHISTITMMYQYHRCCFPSCNFPLAIVGCQKTGHLSFHKDDEFFCEWILLIPLPAPLLLEGFWIKDIIFHRESRAILMLFVHAWLCFVSISLRINNTGGSEYKHPLWA